MSEWRLSPAARADLQEIWDYTAKRWSVEQAERYLRDIAGACQELVEGTRQGVTVNHIREGYLKLAVGSHLLFYRRGSDGRHEVIRVLHRRMDVATRLK